MLLYYSAPACRAEYERALRYKDVSLAVIWLDATDQSQVIIDFCRTKAKAPHEYEREQPLHILHELVGLPFYCSSIASFMAAGLANDMICDYHCPRRKAICLNCLNCFPNSCRY